MEVEATILQGKAAANLGTNLQDSSNNDPQRANDLSQNGYGDVDTLSNFLSFALGTRCHF